MKTVSSLPSTALAAKKRTGKLVLEDVTGEQDLRPFKERHKRGRSTKELQSSTAKRPKSKYSGKNEMISPALAQWAEQDQMMQPEKSSSIPISTRDDVKSVSTYKYFDGTDLSDCLEATPKSRSARREKQASRKSAELLRERKVQEVSKILEELVDGTQPLNVDQILTQLQCLREMDSPSSMSSSSRAITAVSSGSFDYRLAWAGSDDAICHVGTGLHKVPLARLQEVFWTCGPRNQLQMMEVIRILGPFPNVKNVLRGSTKVESNAGSSATWKVTWHSLIDGTGKEIMAGNAESARRVEMQVLFCDPSILVVAVPSEDEADPLDIRDQGRNVLLFLRENALDDKLESLRVA